MLHEIKSGLNSATALGRAQMPQDFDSLKTFHAIHFTQGAIKSSTNVQPTHETHYAFIFCHVEFEP